MKRNVMLFLLPFTILSSFAQVKTQYFDAEWQPTDKANMVFYRPEPKAVNGKYLFKDYYKSGKLQFEGLSLSKTTEKFDGEVKYYQENGKISGISVFENGIERSAAVYTYKGVETNGVTNPYDLITFFENEERVKQIIYDGNPKGMRQEMYLNELKAKYYGADGKLLGEIVFDLYGNPNNGTIVEFDFNPMRITRTRIFKDGKERLPEKI